MTGALRTLRAAALVVVAVCAVPLGRAQDDGEDPLTRREQALSRIEQDMQVLEHDLTDREQRRDVLDAELEQSERDIAALALAGRQLSAMVDEQRSVVAGLEKELTTAAEALEQTRAALAQLLRSAYAMGRGERLRLLLNQEDLVRSGRVFGYYRCLGRERARRVAVFEQQTTRLASLRREAAGEADRLAWLAERQEETRQRLEQRQAQRAAILGELEQAIAHGRERVTKLRADSDALRRLIEILRRDAEIQTELGLHQEDLVARKGRLDWPLKTARLLSPFRGGASAADAHGDGVLLGAPIGSEVRAIHHGRVVYADWLRGFGLLLVIDHGDGYMSLYGHNQTLLKEVGEWVGSGDLIALSGASGGQDANALYFAIRRHGEPVDPAQWCRKDSG